MSEAKVGIDSNKSDQPKLIVTLDTLQLSDAYLQPKVGTNLRCGTKHGVHGWHRLRNQKRSRQ